MIKVVLTAVLVFLFGCASNHMEQYIGKNIMEVAFESGQPENVIDMGDGRRVFQFRWGGGTYRMPERTTTDGKVSVYGNSAWYKQTAVTTGGYSVTSEGCILSYITEWDESKKSWVITETRYPKRLFC